MFQSIVVPTDGSAFAEAALPLATQIALQAKARIGLLLVHQPPAVPLVSGSRRVYDAMDGQTRESEFGYLKDMNQRLKDQGVAASDSSLLSGSVADSLQTEIERRGADLVVMSTHGRGGLSRIWLGSVADRLLHSVTVPLLLVRPVAEGRSPVLCVIERIVVPLDGSPLAETVLEHAMTLATVFGAELYLVRVVPPVLYGAFAMDLPFAYDPALDAALTQEATDYLATLAGTLRSRGFRVATAVDGNPLVAEALLAAVEAAPGALICLSTHGRSGPGRALFGSVADKLVRAASCPVFVWRPGTVARPQTATYVAAAQRLQPAFAGRG
jgi:nucleotide-binding universal stress UspA family protein